MWEQRAVHAMLVIKSDFIENQSGIPARIVDRSLHFLRGCEHVVRRLWVTQIQPQSHKEVGRKEV